MALQLIRKMCNKKQYLELKTSQLQEKKSYIFKAGGGSHRINFQREAVDSPLFKAFQVRLAAFPQGMLQVNIITEFNMWVVG